MMSPKFVVVGLLVAASCLSGIVAFGQTSTAPGGSINSTNGTSDEYSWLEGRRDARALAWVRDKNALTLAHFKADPRFARFRKAVLDATFDPSPLPGYTTVAWAYAGFVYEVRPDGAHPHGIIHRIRLKDLEASSAGWEPIFDVDAFDAKVGAPFDVFGAQCLGTHCLITFVDDSAPIGTRILTQEFDLEHLALDENFSVRSPSILSYGIDGQSLVVGEERRAKSSALGSIYDGPLRVRLVRKGQPLSAAPIILQVDDPKVDYLESYSLDDEGGQLGVLIQTSSEDPAYPVKSWVLDGNGKAVPAHLPPDVSGRARYKGNWLFILGSDWTIDGRTFAAGSVVSINDAQIERPDPQVETVFAPTGSQTLDTLGATRDGLLIVGHEDVQGRVWCMERDADRWAKREISVPPNGDVSFAFNRSAKESGTLISYLSFLSPPSWYDIDVKKGLATLVASGTAQFDASRDSEEQLQATSSDGTKVPYFLVRPNGVAPAGGFPTIIMAYGGNGISIYPYYDPVLGKLWLERGGAFVVASVRGGGELGPKWHEAALRTNRRRTFDDLSAVAEDLVRSGVSSARRMGLSGHSNGAGLMAIMLNQHPTLFHAAVLENGVLDWMRTDLQNASLDVQVERGSPDVPVERAFLLRVSPTQNLRAGSGMPSPFIVTTTTDNTVFPAMSRRYTARMEALRLPFQFYEASEGGHDQWNTPDEKADYLAMKYIYFSQLLMNGDNKEQK